MKKWDDKLNFQEVIDLLFEYSRSPVRSDPNYKGDLVGEVIDKVWEMELLVKKILLLHRKERFFMNITWRWVTLLKRPAPSLLNKGSLERIKEMQAFTEAYYYFAWRCVKAFNELPQLNNIKVGKLGVMIVRNKLLEHPVVTIRSFGFGENGSVVKSGRYQHDKDLFVDNGLYKNADELLIAMKRSLELYIK